MTDYERGLQKLGFGYMLDGVWYWTDSISDTKGGWYGDPMDLRLPKHAAFAWRVLIALRNSPDGAGPFARFLCQRRDETLADALYAAVEAIGKGE